MSTSRWDAVEQMATQSAAGARYDDRTGARVVDRSGDDPAVALCTDVLAEMPALRCLGQYTLGRTDFTVDTLESTGPHTAPALGDVDRLGRELYDHMVRLNVLLTGARTGTLIRSFVSTDRGALHWSEVSESQHLFGLSLTAAADPDDAFERQRANDRAMSALANRLRRRLRQFPRDYGGWLAHEKPRAAGASPAPERSDAAPAPVIPFLQNEGSSLATLCRDWLDPHDLHYTSVFVDGEQIAVADILHHDGLQPFASGTTPHERRRFYADFGRDLDDYSRQLDRKVFNLLDGQLLHLTLDVERGAVFHHSIGSRAYLVAVTLDQDQVAHTESKVRALAARLTGR